MSSLDNSRSKKELGIAYTPMREYVDKLVRYFRSKPVRAIPGYAQRERELALTTAAER
jgi:hypothetical protein